MIKPCARCAVQRCEPWLNMVREERGERTRRVQGAEVPLGTGLPGRAKGPRMRSRLVARYLLFFEPVYELPVHPCVIVGVECDLLQPVAGKPGRGGEHLDRSGARPLEVDNTRNTPVVVHENITLVEIS